ncbi:MAG: sigma 54-interacting transcriptional regulator [Desulfobacterales bacterium]|jgi:PAS domain S-box-containing protein
MPPSGKHYRTILESIADGVFTVDMNWKITSFNKAAENITGISKKEAIGKRCSKVFRADVCENGCILRHTIKTKKPVYNMPVYIIRADKKSIPISVNTTLLRDDDGRVIGGVETFRDLSDVSKLRRVILKQLSFDDIISKNSKMVRLFSMLPLIADSHSTVLLEGASGTGKEIFARTIHNNSKNRNGPFIAINCGALPETLCESELFGYKAGAFTDAKKDKPGRFAMAQNGTIFLDEISDVSKAVQIRLLRVLEEKVYEPLGSTKTIKTNARVIAATHQNLEKLVEKKKFREDLFFRINVMKLSLPKLSERKEDIPLLANHFIEQFNHLTEKKIVAMTQEAMAVLMLYDWPGNVRELENAIEHAFILCRGKLIRLQHLPQSVVPVNDTMLVPTGLTLKEVEGHAVLQALERNQWKRMATARELGIDKNTLRRKIKQYGLVEPLRDI